MARTGTAEKTRLLFLTLLFFSLAACSAPSQRHLETDLQKKGGRNYALQDIYPQSISLSQHVLLKIRGKEFDFPAYLAVDRSRGYRAVAFTGMGGKVFDLLSIEGDKRIVSKPGKMASAPILKGVMEDIGLLFMPYNTERPPYGDKAAIETGHSADGRISSYEIKKSGGLFAKIGLSRYRIFQGWHEPLPAKIEIINYRWDYVIEVELLKINMAPINEKVLNMELMSND